MKYPEIVFENENFLAVNKPPGVLVDQVRAVGKLLPENRNDTLAGWLETRHSKARLVHRLDKDTSGIILAAKTDEYFDYLKKLFKERTIKKTYVALVCDAVKKRTGIIDAPIGIKHGMVRQTIHAPKNEREAVTEYRVESYFKNNSETFTLLKVRPKTGRTHQIRVHLNSIHHPVVGDKLYGKDTGNISPRQLLHAESLEFSLKEGGRVMLEAALAQDFAAILSRLAPCDPFDS